MGKVPDTPPEPPTPSSSSSSGAGAGAGASGRAASAAAGAASWWDGVVKFSRRELERGRSKLKGIDLQPHMTVEMDFIKPFATNVKNVWRDACALVPPPVKKAAPFALSAAGGCIVTHAIMKAANVRTLPHPYSLRARLPSLFVCQHLRILPMIPPRERWWAALPRQMAPDSPISTRIERASERV